MRLDPKLVHPSLFKATDGVMWGTGYATTDASVISAHQSAWFKEYGAGCLGYCFGAFALFCATGWGLKAFEVDKPVRVLTMILVLIGLIAAGAIATVRHSRNLSVNELESVLPLLKLSDMGKAYSETIIALHRSGRPKAEIEESMIALNALLDEEARLVDVRTRLAGTDLTNEREVLAAERQRILDKIASTKDPSARDAFEQSLALVEERQTLFESQGTSIERLDAHLELLRQAVLSTRDAARRLSGAPTASIADLAIGDLRSAIATARAQTQETERALAELRAV
ncbi:hypothetical protein EON82_08445 [bacterium]|nr:MAG: hypothetical protein EON82_08445 [bacterium]